MPPTRRDALLASAALAVPATAEPLPRAKPEDVGIDARQLQVVYDLLEKWTAGPDAPVPAAGVVVGRKGKVVGPRLFGRMGPEPDAAPIRDDALFILASVTKPFVYMAALRLVERGLLDLSDPVTRHLPDFKADDKELVRVGHLFTHTSGLPDMPPGNADLRKAHAPVQKFLDAAVRDTTLLFRPGTRLSYQSCGTAAVAEIVQRLTGKPIAEHLKKELLDPLGLKNTNLGRGSFARERLVRVRLPEEMIGTDWSWNSDYWQDLGAPWGGMYSTPDDVAVVCQALLAKGTWNGFRLLSPATVRAMTTNRLADYPDLPEPVGRTQPWGLGWRLNHPGTPDSWGDLLGREVFGHTGSTGTLVWVDPAADGFCVLLTSLPRSFAPWRLVRLSNAVAAAFA